MGIRDMFHTIGLGVQVLGEKIGCPSCFEFHCGYYDYKEMRNAIPKKMNVLFEDVDIINNYLIFDEEEYHEEFGSIVEVRKCVFERELEHFEEIFDNAYKKMNTIVTHSANYRGIIPLEENVKTIIKEFGYGGFDKGKAIQRMKFWASMNGYDVVYNIVYDHQGRKATGVFGKLVK